MSKELIQKTAEYVKSKLYNEPSGHDWYHVERVWKCAQFIQTKEGGDLELIEFAALLHNLGEHSDYSFNAEKGPLILFGMMDILGIEDPLKSNILHIAHEIKYGGVETKKPRTLEGQIVQDANFLDSFGAIGVARRFASGGYYGRPIYDPGMKVRKQLTKYAYEREKNKGSSLGSFYERVLKLTDRLNTATARRIAQHKIRFTNLFIEQFMKEWEGDEVESL